MKFFELESGYFSDELEKYFLDEHSVDDRVESVIRKMEKDIISSGFTALSDYTKKLDNFELNTSNFMVSKDEISRLSSKIDPLLDKSLITAIERIKAFHKNQLEKGFEFTDHFGNRMGQKIVPIESVAVYVPGGQALYPSTFYMTVIPALIAGVKRIVVLTPPRTFEESSEIARLVEYFGIEEVYRGAGAALVLAAANGVDGLKKVDKIVGPGNSYIAKAKQLSYGKIDIDMIAGPSDITVLVDTTNDDDIPLIASDLLSQAEHGPDSPAIAVGTDKDYLLKVRDEVYRQASLIPNSSMAKKSLDEKGLLIQCPNMDDVLSIVNKIAPEHLELFSNRPHDLLGSVKYAGSVFLGRYTPESVGDYFGGPNHVLPTSRTARFYSPLGVYDFTKRLSWIEYSKRALEETAADITRIARSEKLEAHARAVEIRFNNGRT